ncbi:MAG: hypothetical protein AAFQ96_05345 [Pseudomonadota bacterium]
MGIRMIMTDKKRSRRARLALQSGCKPVCAALTGLAGLAVMAAAPAGAHPHKDGAHGNHSETHSVTHTRRHDGIGNFVIKSDRIDLQADWRGSFEINMAGDGFDALDGRFAIKQLKGRKSDSVVFKGDGEVTDVIYAVDDRTRDIGPEEKQRIRALLQLFVMESGIDAEQRVAALYGKGGAGVVFDVVEKMLGSHGARKYLTALAESEQLSGAELSRYAALTKALDGDHAKSKAIRAVLAHQSDLDEKARAEMIDVASDLESDHEIRKILQAIANDKLSPATAKVAMTMLMTISSDHEFRKGAGVILSNRSFSDDQRAAVIRVAADKIDSAHELRKIVAMGGACVQRSKACGDASLKAVRAIDSDHEKRKSVSIVSGALPAQSAYWGDLMKAADAIASDHEKRKALAAIASHMPHDQKLVTLYKQSAERLSSESERKKALAVVN